jgi:subtilisin family serine protease
VYVLDSGVDTGHPDFGGRATNDHDATGGDSRARMAAMANQVRPTGTDRLLTYTAG